VLNNKRAFEQRRLRQLKTVLEHEDQHQRKVTLERNREIERSCGAGGLLARRLEREERRQTHLRNQIHEVGYASVLADMEIKRLRGGQPK